MTDTPKHIYEQQFAFYHSKSWDDKLKMLTEMMEYGVEQTLVVLKQWYPNKSEEELKIAFFKLYYKNDFNDSQMKLWEKKLRGA